MNRAERRRKVPLSDAVNVAVAHYTVAMLWVMYDHLGLTNEQMATGLKKVQDTFDSINRGYLTIEDIQKTLAEEADFRITLH